MTELYRLQNGQQVSDLDSERMDSLEFGWRTERQNWRSDLVVYTMRKKDSVFRDAQGFNVSGARTRHRGIEASWWYAFRPRWSSSLDATFARHRYDFTFTPERGEQFVSGRDVDSAPAWLGSARLQYRNPGVFNLELQWVYLDEYFLDAENRFKYAGHELINLRAGWWLSDRAQLILRLNNVSDSAYADRADFAFGNYRYFPGRGRELFAEIRYLPKGSE
jgi:outer membrane cobalamin receptor